MKSAPLPARWGKDDTNYLQIAVEDTSPTTPSASEIQAGLTFVGKNKKSGPIRKISLAAAPREGSAYVLGDFMQALGTKKNWPGTLRISINRSHGKKSISVCEQEMRVYVSD